LSPVVNYPAAASPWAVPDNRFPGIEPRVACTGPELVAAAVEPFGATAVPGEARAIQVCAGPVHAAVA
jgi:hypothetical protein